MFSTLILLLLRERLRWHVFHVAIWVLAMVGGLGFLVWFSAMRELPPIQLWGLWLHLLLALTVALLEIIVLAGRTRYGTRMG